MIGSGNFRYIDLSQSDIANAYLEGKGLDGAASILGVSSCTLLDKIKKLGFSGTVEFRNSLNNQLNHKVTRIIPIEELTDVYDLQVPQYHNYVANGVVIHNCGYFDPGFQGTATWEIHVVCPDGLTVKKGQRLMQLVMEECATPMNPYTVTGRYSGQVGPTPAKESK